MRINFLQSPLIYLFFFVYVSSHIFASRFFFNLNILLYPSNVFQVDLFREITFKNSKQSYKGIPVIASNMDTIGTFDMAVVLAKVTMYTAQFCQSRCICVIC